MGKEGLVTRNEAILLGIITVFAIVWMFLIVPFLSEWTWFQQQIPPVQFLLFELGFLVGLITALGFPIQYAYVSKKNDNDSTLEVVIGAVKIGVSAWLGNKLVLAMLDPPFYLSHTGQVILDNPEAMTGTSVDATVTWVWQQAGLSGPMLYNFVYIVTPILVVTAIVLAFTWKRVAKILTGAI
jgi:hypothetical protein